MTTHRVYLVVILPTPEMRKITNGCSEKRVEVVTVVVDGYIS